MTGPQDFLVKKGSDRMLGPQATSSSGCDRAEGLKCQGPKLPAAVDAVVEKGSDARAPIGARGLASHKQQ
eukprot:355292-Chlamydomonas_euryale.AAC.5